MKPSWELFAAAVAVAVVVLAWIARRFRAFFASRRARRRSARAIRGEGAAEALLEGRGYRILERQSSLTWEIDRDGEPWPVELRADLLVERDGEIYVAEVKTGESAPSLAYAATRRQLLEYAVAYDVDCVLLVDVEADEVVEVRFWQPLCAAPSPDAEIDVEAAIVTASAEESGRRSRPRS